MCLFLIMCRTCGVQRISKYTELTYQSLGLSSDSAIMTGLSIVSKDQDELLTRYQQSKG